MRQGPLHRERIHLIVRRNENSTVRDNGCFEFLNGGHRVRGGSTTEHARSRNPIETVQFVV